MHSIGNTRIVIDGFPIESLYDLRIDVDSYDVGPYLSDPYTVKQISNVRVTLRAGNGAAMEFVVEDKEQIGDTVYFYGPLRALFPTIFADIDPLPWQVAYLAHTNRPSLDRFKLRRNDSYFQTVAAQAFGSGYERGYTAGALLQTKKTEEKPVTKLVTKPTTKKQVTREELANRLRGA